MSKYIKKTEQEKQYNRMMAQVKRKVTLALKKPMPAATRYKG